MEKVPGMSKEQNQTEPQAQAKTSTKQQVKKDPATAPKVDTKGTETKKPQPSLNSVAKPPVQKSQPASVPHGKPVAASESSGMTKDQVHAEREAKKLAKQSKKKGGAAPATNEKPATTETPASLDLVSKPTVQIPQPASVPQANPESTEASKDKVHAEREAKKLAKQAKKKGGAVPENSEKPTTTEAPAVAKSQAKPVVSKENVAPVKPAAAEIVVKMDQLNLANDATSEKVKQVPSKAERRAIQEAQRAMKAKALEDKKVVVTKTATKVAPKAHTVSAAKASTGSVSSLHKVKLFKHLYKEKCSLNLNVNSTLHPAIVKLGIQYANDTVVGSNSRCYAFLNAMKKVIIYIHIHLRLGLMYFISVNC